MWDSMIRIDGRGPLSSPAAVVLSLLRPAGGPSRPPPPYRGQTPRPGDLMGVGRTRAISGHTGLLGVTQLELGGFEGVAMSRGEGRSWGWFLGRAALMAGLAA